MYNIIEYKIINNRDIKKVKEYVFDRSNEYSDADLINDLFNVSNQKNESVYLLVKDNRKRTNAVMLLNTGTENNCKIDTQKAINFLCFCKGDYFSMFHNHPNNLVYPSQDDIISALIMKTLGKVYNTKFEGSYILGKETWITVENSNTSNYYYDKRRKN